MTLGNWKTLSEVISAWVTMVGLVLAGIFATYQYLDHKHDIRVERVLAMSARFSDPTVLNARIRLDSAWERAYSALDALLNANKRPNAAQADINAAFASFVVTHIHESQLGDSLNILLDFLDDLAVCLRANLCDQATANRLLEYGHDSFRRYYPYICQQRRDWNEPQFALRVEQVFNPRRDGTTVCSEAGATPPSAVLN